jgi:putative FmdB family regulatory protein
MFYKFRCIKCRQDFEVDLSIKEYDKEKNNQKCPFCFEKAERVIEWTGIAQGSGEGWAGRSSGNVI